MIFNIEEALYVVAKGLATNNGCPVSSVVSRRLFWRGSMLRLVCYGRPQRGVARLVLARKIAAGRTATKERLRCHRLSKQLYTPMRMCDVISEGRKIVACLSYYENNIFWSGEVVVLKARKGRQRKEWPHHGDRAIFDGSGRCETASI